MSKGARQRAVDLFKKSGEETSTPLSEREAERRAAAAKTARLRASRLARDAGKDTTPKPDSDPKPT